MLNKKEIGNKYEDVALNYLLNKGYKILDRNFYYKGGEIDIIAKDKDILVFVEVKYRKNLRYGTPIEAVTNFKIRNIIKGANLYINTRHIEYDMIRFDVIGILGDNIEHIENIFN